MIRFTNTELDIINISLGLIIKYNRLESGYSQFDLGLNSDTDNTTVGRIERAEHVSAWQSIYKVCQALNINYCTLFKLKSENELLKLVDDCLSLETKLTQKKTLYYDNLKTRIRNLFIKKSKEELKTS